MPKQTAAPNRNKTTVPPAATLKASGLLEN